ncbi:MAG TPA: class I SAM-dependent methyltransferase [Roseiflexaceae bacterium]|nr:class I SAM-dependent methyltransferase [Roseiflexaceae bacterium]
MGSLLSAEGDAAMRAYYDQRADEYDQWYLREGRFAGRSDPEGWHADVAQLRERVRAFAGGRLLELASGTGWWTQELARRAQVTAVDYAPAMLALARGRLRARGLRAAFVRADAYALPFAAGAFERCLFGFWLSHVPLARLPGFLAGVRRVLAPGALVLVLDSAPTEPEQLPGVEYLHERVLNDGSRHEVLKILHTPETLAQALAPLGTVREAFSTGVYFSGALIQVEARTAEDEGAEIPQVNAKTQRRRDAKV